MAVNPSGSVGGVVLARLIAALVITVAAASSSFSCSLLSHSAPTGFR
jgi:hypothetical protein